ncbi:MAG: dipeptidase [bacterium]|nr:dipeptidase [bacterium]
MHPIPVFDGHNDTLYHLFLPEKSKGRTFFVESSFGHIDYPRAKKGGLIGGFFGIYTPPPKSTLEPVTQFNAQMTESEYNAPLPPPLNYDYAHTFVHSVIDFAEQLEQLSAGKVKIVRRYSELQQWIENDILAFVLHIEGAEAINPDLSDLPEFYQRGVRSLGLVWSRPNAFGSGVPFRYPSSPDIGHGLTQAGKNLVAACNELGIILDLSHLNEQGFWDVAKLSKHPLVVSHTGVHAICPSSRNLTDEQIDAIADSGGVVGIMFQPAHLQFSGNKDPMPNDNVAITDIVKHIDYIKTRIGIEHVAFGSDFDGAQMPKELNDVSGLQKLIEALRQAEYADKDIEKIAYKNWFRVIQETWIRG